MEEAVEATEESHELNQYITRFIKIKLIIQKTKIQEEETLIFECCFGKRKMTVTQNWNSFKEFSADINVQQHSDKKFKYKICSSSKRTVLQKEIKTTYSLCGERCNTLYLFCYDVEQDDGYSMYPPNEEVSRLFWDEIWKLNNLEKMHNLFGLFLSLKEDKASKDSLVQSIKVELKKGKESQQPEDFINVIVLLVALVASEWKLDAILQELCEALSLNGFNDLSSVMGIINKDFKDHFDIITNQLETFYSRREFSTIGKCSNLEWIYPLVLLNYFKWCLKKDQLQLQLTREHLKCMLENLKKYAFCLELDYSLFENSLHKNLIDLMEPSDFYNAIKSGFFDIADIIDKMRDYIAKHKTSAQIDEIIKSLNLILAYETEKEDDKRNHWVLYASCQMLDCALETLDWSYHDNFYLLLFEIIKIFEKMQLKMQVKNKLVDVVKLMDSKLFLKVQNFHNQEKALKQLPIFHSLITLKIGDIDCKSINENSFNELRKKLITMACVYPCVYIQFYDKCHTEKYTDNVTRLLSTQVKICFYGKKNTSSEEFMEKVFKSEKTSKVFLDHLKNELQKLNKNVSITERVFAINGLKSCLDSLGKIKNKKLKQYVEGIAKQLCLHHSIKTLGEVKKIVAFREEFIEVYEKSVNVICKQPIKKEVLICKISKYEEVCCNTEEICRSMKNFFSFLQSHDIANLSLFQKQLNFSFDELETSVITSKYLARHFMVTEKHLKLLRRIEEYDILSCKILQQYKDSSFRSKVNSPKQLERFLDNMETVVLKKLKDWIKEFIDGKIAISMINNVYNQTNVNDMKNEVKAIVGFFDIKKDFSPIWNKIETFRDLKRIANLAQLITEILEALSANNTDQLIHVLDEISNKVDILYNSKLCEVNEDIFKIATMLKQITNEQEEVLAAVHKCLALVVWIHQKFKDEKELRKFVNIILNCSQTTLEVQRVTSFDESYNGIKKILMIKDSDSAVKNLLDATAEIAKKFRHNYQFRGFLKALVKTNRYLLWFENSLLSGEQQTFANIQTINEKGCYVIESNISEQLLNKTTDKSVMKLIIPSDEVWNKFKNGLNKLTIDTGIILNSNAEKDLLSGNDDSTSVQTMKTEYNSLEMDDLQSMLVLLGDSKMDEKRKKHREYFVQVYNSMKELSNVFYNLIQAGRLDLCDSQYIFKCNIKTKSKLQLPTEEIKDLQEKYDSQIDTIHEMRLKEPLLNHFSSKQCLMLQKYLADILRFGTVETLYRKVMDLLAPVDKNLSVAGIKNSLSYCFENKSSHVENYNDQDSFHGMKIGKIRELIEALMNQGRPENTVYASVMSVEPLSIPAAIKWWTKIGTKLDKTEIQKLASNCKELLDQMSEGCDETYSNVDDDVSTTETDQQQIQEKETKYLSLYQLVQFLKAVNETAANQIYFDKKKLFSESKPYLIIMKKEKIMETMLYIYLESYGTFPHERFVLYCNKHTTEEEIKLLIRRAMLEPTGIFALMFVDELHCTTLQEIVWFLESVLTQYGLRNPLLLFCSRKKNSFALAFQSYYHMLQIEINGEFLKAKFRKCLVSTENNSEISASTAVLEKSYCLVVSSIGSGMGKSFQVKQKTECLNKIIVEKYNRKPEDLLTRISIPIFGNHVDVDEITNCILSLEAKKEEKVPIIYHFDISTSVRFGLEGFLFNLVVLGKLQNQNGVIWRRRKIDGIILEITYRDLFTKENSPDILKFLHELECVAPKKCLNKASAQDGKFFSKEVLKEKSYQRVYQYLFANEHDKDLSKMNFKPHFIHGTASDCLSTITRYCGTSPSWTEISNFVKFFDKQLENCELSSFCTKTGKELMKGFKKFVVMLSLNMSKDFALSAINHEKDEEDLIFIDSGRKWEKSSHPYLFFNGYGQTFSFVGFNIDEQRNVVVTNRETKRKEIVMANIMSKELYNGLLDQFKLENEDYIRFNTDFSALGKNIKLELLCRVFGVEYFEEIDPNQSFVLTIDNVIKMLAIHMRFRANIPVVMMGDTGCGKTELIKYMAALLRTGRKDMQNLLLAKIHGGTTNEQIKNYIEDALNKASENCLKGIDTILFFDECNTSRVVGLVKEIMMDSSCLGKPLDLKKNRLKVVAAINPYKPHSHEMIRKIESSGLGYFDDEKVQQEWLGNYPLHHLVYRVQKLPNSLEILVWDYGQLNEETEREYIKEIVKKHYVKFEQSVGNQKTFLVEILSFSQKYMRDEKDECRFVSLRDVKRFLQVLLWFEKKICLFVDPSSKKDVDLFKVACLLSLHVCYISKLVNRSKFVDKVLQRSWFTRKAIEEIESIQKAIVEKMVLKGNVALNKALCESVFMMLVCIELRIPLFIVGKPGSSKSFAKSIIEDNMRGDLSESMFCRNFKQVSMVSYQCSILSTSEGIISTFNHGKKYQENKDKDLFVSAVVLDEVGLAEASPEMPLKALQPLLEDGIDNFDNMAIDERKEISNRPAFLGLSNFAIDPAKMNRGIMLNLVTPDKGELYKIASGLCKSDPEMQEELEVLLRKLTIGYFDVYENQKINVYLIKTKKPEFFGLRDYYSLIKEIFFLAQQNRKVPDLEMIKVAVLRNFSGLEDFDAWSIFRSQFTNILIQDSEEPYEILPLNIIKQETEKQDANQRNCFISRYLLLITEEFDNLEFIQNVLLNNNPNVRIIFGSSFPKDEEFSKVCRDIKHIKVCMEKGMPVILLNMENMYESLYDALNQHYDYFDGKKYIHLGLGAHRVRCQVHDDFKLVVIANKSKVYERFPIPLINRLEKHFVLPFQDMPDNVKKVCRDVSQWASRFAYMGKPSPMEDYLKLCQAFPGHNKNTVAALVSKLCKLKLTDEELLKEAKKQLVHSATPAAVISFHERGMDDSNEWYEEYFEDTRHHSFQDFLNYLMQEEAPSKNQFLQVTTFSRPLIEGTTRFHLLNLEQYQTEGVFREKIKDIAETQKANKDEVSCFVVIQCTDIKEEQKCINCAKYICTEFIRDNESPLQFIFVLQLSNNAIKLVGLHTNWTTIHIDSLDNSLSPIWQIRNKRLSQLFESSSEVYRTMLRIVRSCIQSVIKDLNYTKQMTYHTITDKIKFIQDVFDSNQDWGFLFVEKVMEHIKAQLMEEERDEGQDASWICHAIEENNQISIFGSFDHSLVHYIEEKVKPLLTTFLHKYDINNNLLLMGSPCNDTKEIWQNLFRGKWLEFSSVNVSMVNFTNLFPFSLNLMLHTERIIQKKGEIGCIKRSLDQTLPKIMIGDQQKSDYIYDFIRLKMPDCNKKIAEILSEALAYEVKKKVSKNMIPEHRSELNSLLACSSVTYDEYELRFTHVAKIANLREAIWEEFQVSCDEREMHFDVLMMEHLINSIWPHPIEYIQGEFGNEWALLLKQLRFYMNYVSLHVAKMFGEISKQIYKGVFIKWIRIRIFQIFLENVVGSYSQLKEHYISKFLKDLQSIETILETERCWVNFSTKIIESISAMLSIFDNEEEKENVKKKWNLFYVNILSEFCFNRSDGLHVETSVIAVLIQQALSNNHTESLLQIHKINERSLKSYLVKQFLRKMDDEKIYKVIDKSLESFSKKNMTKDFLEICYLFLSAFEDSIAVENKQIYNISPSEDSINNEDGNIAAFVLEISEYLTQEKNGFINLTGGQLNGLAKIRYALTAACHFMHNVCINAKNEKRFQQLFRLTETFCTNGESHYFCLRYLFNTFGMSNFKKILKKFGWLRLKNMQDDIPNMDVFLVYGEEYKQLRDQIRQELRQQHPLSQLFHVCTNLKQDVKVTCLTREIMLANAKHMLTDDIKDPEGLKGSVKEQISIFDKIDGEDNWLKDLLLHLEAVLKSDGDACKLVQLILNNPNQLKGLFLPGMPSDKFDKFRNQQVSKHNLKQFECENGHSPVVEKYGLLSISYRCSKCNTFLEKKLTTSTLEAVVFRDKTKKGFCGGYAEERPVEGCTERNLENIKSVALQRFLVDLSFYKLFLINPKSAAQSITLPLELPENRLQTFFKDHVEADLDLIQRKLGNNFGDNQILVHLFLKHIHTSSWKNNDELLETLRTKEGRCKYEVLFDEGVIEPFLKENQTDFQPNIKKFKDITLYDPGRGENHALKKLFETELEALPSTTNEHMFSNWVLWKKHTSVSFTNFMNYVDKAKKEHKKNIDIGLLQDFLEQEKQLEMVKCLPDLIQLQRILFAAYNFRYSRQSIQKMIRKDALRGLTGEVEVQDLLQCFCDTWNKVKQDLEYYGRCPTDIKTSLILHERSSLAYFICSKSGYGQCATTLIDYLAFLQHSFLKKWESSRHMKFVTQKMMKVMDINRTDVISYTRETDLIPLLYTFSSYTMNDNRHMTIEYEIQNIESCVVEKVFLCAAQIDCSSMEYLVYYDDVRAAKSFNFFASLVPQTNIQLQDVNLICSELKDCSDLARALEAIEISIAFLSVTPGDGNKIYKDFIEKVLLMDVDIYIKSKTFRKIKLMHLTSAWLALTVESKMRLLESKKVPFNIEKTYQEELEDDVKKHVEGSIQHHSLKSIIDILTEFILFKLDDSPDPMKSLFEVMHRYENEMEKPCKSINDELLKYSFGGRKILVQHSYSFWKMLVILFKKYNSI